MTDKGFWGFLEARKGNIAFLDSVDAKVQEYRAQLGNN